MFTYISDIDKSTERKYLLSNIDLYIKLLKAFAKKNLIEYSTNNCFLSDKTIKRIQELTIFKKGNKLEVDLLKKILGKSFYDDFITAVNFELDHKKKLGSLIDKLDPIKRNLIQKSSQESGKPKIVDFFCGAGGLSLGFTQEGFQVDFANDYDRVCIETYRYNHPEIPENRVVLGDIRNVVKKIDKLSFENIDVVVGGPPCQGFSTANQQRIIDDPRNELYKFFIKAVEIIAPKFVVMENVKGMLPYAKQVVEDYKNIKAIIGEQPYYYSVDYKILSSDEFGVAQKRQRLFFIAIRNDISDKCNINPTDIFNEIVNNNKANKQFVLGDAISYIKPLQAPRIKNLTEVDDEETGKKVDINIFNGQENEYLRQINQNREISYVFNHKARYVNEVNFQIYSLLKQGDDGTSQNVNHIMPYLHRNHIFKDKYYKLIENKPSRTITAHLKMDCHSHIHPNQIRSLTPREAARIQSFPDDYVFMGSYLKTYMQIGNAVPPIMSRGIAKAIMKHIS